MLFNTYHFVYFLAIVFGLYWILPARLRPAFILGSSYYFYACWDARFLGLLILSTAFDFACGLALDKIAADRKRRLFVALSMALNLGMLGYFKYFNFFAESLEALLRSAGAPVSLGTLKIILPIGISFYTFQSMSYVIDVYRREIKPTRNFIQFAAFVSFFPHLVAGPIMRPTTLLPQIQTPRKFRFGQFSEGTYLLFWGLAKKVVVADNLALFVNKVFSASTVPDGGTTLLAVYAFAFQIYCDFSGYTDMARGAAKWLGFELGLNFNLPYFATSPREFWSRWHISLSNWLRDYLYIPLGGSRGGRGVMYRNLMLTMVIGGLWHGASWTFVAWGFYQGILLVGHRLLEPALLRVRPARKAERVAWKTLRILVTFHLICMGWLFFRATSITQAFAMLRAIATEPAIPPLALVLPVAAVIVPLIVVQTWQYLAHDLQVVFKAPWYVRSLFYTAVFYAIVLGGEFGGGQFIYFQF